MLNFVWSPIAVGDGRNPVCHVQFGPSCSFPHVLPLRLPSCRPLRQSSEPETIAKISRLPLISDVVGINSRRRLPYRPEIAAVPSNMASNMPAAAELHVLINSESVLMTCYRGIHLLHRRHSDCNVSHPERPLQIQ